MEPLSVIVRLSKTLLVAAIAFYYTLVVFNNLTDYGSNYLFVHHVLLMDTTLPGSRGMGRAIHPLWIQMVFYDTIIVWESVTAVLCWTGAVALLRNARAARAGYERARGIAIAGLTLGMLMWFVAFLSIGGEWFLMWQSRSWNGQNAAFRMFAILGLVMVLLLIPESPAAESA